MNRPSHAIRLAAVGLAAWLAGCTHAEVRVLGELPAPVFATPAAESAVGVKAAGPAANPQARPPAAAPIDEQAGWRNHVQPARDWQWIVIHHSATPEGNAAEFDKFHRAPPRCWDELGYHFVIDNGRGGPDGRIEVGPRWIKQKHGAHCATPSHRFNEHGIGVCLVGDLEKTRPTAAQWASAVRLCAFLCREYGISPAAIIGHRDAQATEKEVSTDCPGKHLDLDAFRRAVAAAAAGRN